MRSYNILALAIASATAVVSAEMHRPHLFMRQNGIANPALQTVSSSPDTIGNGEQSNAFAAPTVATTNMLQQQTDTDANDQQTQSQQMQTDDSDQTAGPSGSQSQSLPSTLFDDLPGFLGVTLPGQSQASAPTTTSGLISADSDAARTSVVSSTSDDDDTTLGSSSAAANNLNLYVAVLLALVTAFTRH
ncbi:hypothetical protein LPJ59_004785 [Coemansia sp. RSA 2399]|nr:hypothetical protein LPJ59_004785 [Coemansia sp. RSA 2399]